MDLTVFLITLLISIITLFVPILFTTDDGILTKIFFITFFSLNLFAYFYAVEKKEYIQVNEFEYNQDSKNYRWLIFDSINRKRNISVDTDLKIHLYEQNESHDIGFLMDIDFKKTAYSFNSMNNKGKVNIGFPKNFICLNDSLFYSYSDGREIKEIFNVGETEKTYINKDFIELERINKLNSGKVELIFKLNKYESYSLLLKDEDNAKLIKSDKNNITGLLYTKNNKKVIDDCFSQQLEIHIQNEEAYNKLKNLTFHH